MSFSIRHVAGAVLMAAGVTILIGSATYAVAQTTDQPSAPATASALTKPQGLGTAPLTVAQQNSAVSVALNDAFVSGLMTGQHVTVSNATAVPWQHGNGVGIGIAVRLTMSAPITIPANHPSIVFGAAEIASAKGYRAEVSPVRVDNAPGVVVFIEEGSGTVVGLQPLFTPGSHAKFIAPPGYVWPSPAED
ncbi:MAG: hypothetical protein HOV87_04500 [Catenulispora sp.]|nr:hypothetical protein [Catenulispora sp.]